MNKKRYLYINHTHKNYAIYCGDTLTGLSLYHSFLRMEVEFEIKSMPIYCPQSFWEKLDSEYTNITERNNTH
jgi:hypothetical protein